VGKTNISTRFVRDSFNEVSQATLGVEFMTKVVEINGQKTKISLWDTAGQERYKALSKVYYKGASGAIVVYDITDAKSYIDV
jgi:small GTP-binding protein